jgi:beta-1,4-N-acetylglucosaminyltransferase
VIFVTVGTTLVFDDLIECVDKMVKRGELPPPVCCQIGAGKYEPRHCDWFRFKPDIAAQLDAASLVIGHGGTGTVTSLVRLGKPFVAVANPAAAGEHQRDFLASLAETMPIVWTDRLEDLPECIQRARNRVAPPYQPGQQLVSDLAQFLKSKSRGRDA